MGTSGNPAVRSAMDRARAEAARTAMEDLDDPVVATLTGKTLDKNDQPLQVEIVVPSFLDWEDGALAAIQRGDFRAWAEMSLDDENLGKWISVRPTNRTVAAFFDSWEKQSGEDLGELRAS